MPQALNLVARGHGDGDDVLGGLSERHVEQGLEPAARLDLGTGPLGVVRAERSSRSAWNALAAGGRCSGARFLRTPSHVKASLTATKVERSLLAAERSVWVAGVVDEGVVVRREVVWPVSVVVAVDMGTWDLLGGGGWEGPAA